jgi:hypothetical protein
VTFVDGWDIRARRFGVVICATPRLGMLDRGITIPWRVIAAQIPLASRNMPQEMASGVVSGKMADKRQDG